SAQQPQAGFETAQTGRAGAEAFGLAGQGHHGLRVQPACAAGNRLVLAGHEVQQAGGQLPDVWLARLAAAQHAGAELANAGAGGAGSEQHRGEAGNKEAQRGEGVAQQRLALAQVQQLQVGVHHPPEGRGLAAAGQQVALEVLPEDAQRMQGGEAGLGAHVTLGYPAGVGGLVLGGSWKRGFLEALNPRMPWRRSLLARAPLDEMLLQGRHSSRSRLSLSRNGSLAQLRPAALDTEEASERLPSSSLPSSSMMVMSLPCDSRSEATSAVPAGATTDDVDASEMVAEFCRRLPEARPDVDDLVCNQEEESSRPKKLLKKTVIAGAVERVAIFLHWLEMRRSGTPEKSLTKIAIQSATAKPSRSSMSHQQLHCHGKRSRKSACPKRILQHQQQLADTKTAAGAACTKTSSSYEKRPRRDPSPASAPHPPPPLLPLFPTLPGFPPQSLPTKSEDAGAELLRSLAALNPQLIIPTLYATLGSGSKRHFKVPLSTVQSWMRHDNKARILRAPPSLPPPPPQPPQPAPSPQPQLPPLPLNLSFPQLGRISLPSNRHRARVVLPSKPCNKRPGQPPSSLPSSLPTSDAADTAARLLFLRSWRDRSASQNAKQCTAKSSKNAECSPKPAILLRMSGSTDAPPCWLACPLMTLPLRLSTPLPPLPPPPMSPPPAAAADWRIKLADEAGRKPPTPPLRLPAPSTIDAWKLASLGERGNAAAHRGRLVPAVDGVLAQQLAEAADRPLAQVVVLAECRLQVAQQAANKEMLLAEAGRQAELAAHFCRGESREF
uniref:Homeobox domain-containing protein n=1 Tax=Macrostomum lignano TaxID=282301 RepID=A0A1I8IVX4_9PLAT